MRRELSGILEQVDRIQSLDLTTCPPRRTSALENVMRDDAPRPSLPVEEALREAPEVVGDASPSRCATGRARRRCSPSPPRRRRAPAAGEIGAWSCSRLPGPRPRTTAGGRSWRSTRARPRPGAGDRRRRGRPPLGGPADRRQGRPLDPRRAHHVPGRASWRASGRSTPPPASRASSRPARSCSARPTWTSSPWGRAPRTPPIR